VASVASKFATLYAKRGIVVAVLVVVAAVAGTVHSFFGFWGGAG
jgi:hypothetical protein